MPSSGKIFKDVMISDISILIAGKAGDGVLFTGNVLAKILKRSGWEVATYRDFPSNIRGEPTNYSIRASLKKIHGRADEEDVLMAFDCAAILKHRNQIARGGVVFCDGQDMAELVPQAREKVTFHKFPLRKLAKQNFGDEIFKNILALGALSYVLNLDFSIIKQVIFETFLKKKGKEITHKNIEALLLGMKEAKKVIKEEECHAILKKKDGTRLLLSGDEAIALGALAGGCRFFAAYPICPATEIWQWLALHLPQYNGIVIQTEDELAAINMALGASFAGTRAMTATSGPGASLMMEGYSLSGMAEIPLVVAHVQRTGPSTGMPTKTEQGDLNQWLYGSHGEFPRIILAPGTLEECFEFTVKAFNLAEKYQCPVILLTEQDYAQNLRTVKEFDLSRVKIDRGKLLSQEELLQIKDFKRYQFTPDGVSPRSIPSLKNGIHMVEGNEHDEKGYRNEDPKNRIKMMKKRMKKLKKALKDVTPSQLWGRKEARIGIIGFGSTFGPIREAMDQLEKKGIQSKFLQLRTLWPFPRQEVEKFIGECREVFVVENNFTGQLRNLIQSQVKSAVELRNINKYSSLSFRPQEISTPIQKVA